jgi:hypothetical protein
MWKQFYYCIMGRGWKSFEVHARNMDVKGKCGEISDGTK